MCLCLEAARMFSRFCVLWAGAYTVGRHSRGLPAPLEVPFNSSMLLRIGEQEQNAPLSKICLQFFFFIFFFWRREKIQFGRFLSFAGHATPICTAEKNEKEITYGGIFWGLSLVLFYGTCVNATERDVLPTITTATTAVVVEEGKKKKKKKTYDGSYT